ncbi:hypothetical protein FRC00_005962, partial [Tulasnella sp. 408]
EDDNFDELEESSGYSTPGNPREMEDDQVNAGLDHELFRTPPESFDQPSPNSPSSLNDIGSFIVYNSQDPVRINASFCDIIEGVHSTAGRVALKRPRINLTDDTTSLRRFEAEARRWQSLKHPHILSFLGAFTRDGYLYLVSPFIDNGKIIEYINVYPHVNRIRLLCEAADAINYLHQTNIVHGDIKGGSILIDHNGHALLCDFHLSKTSGSRTAPEMKGAGTLRWQSPELWNNASKTMSSDVYAFAMTIVEM